MNAALNIVACVDRLPMSLVLVQGAVNDATLFHGIKSWSEGDVGLSSRDPVASVPEATVSPLSG